MSLWILPYDNPCTSRVDGEDAKEVIDAECPERLAGEADAGMLGTLGGVEGIRVDHLLDDAELSQATYAVEVRLEWMRL